MTNPDGTQEIQIGARISRSLYDKILKRRSRAKELTGIEPSVSEVVRAMLEESTDRPKRVPR